MWSYAQTPNIWAICQKSPPRLMPFSRFGQIQELVCWATSRSMAPGGPLVRLLPKWPDPQMHQIYPKKCHFRSLLNDVVDLLHKRHKRWRCASCWAGSCTEGPSAFSSHVWKSETAPWLEMKTLPKISNDAWEAKHLAIVNAIKCLSPTMKLEQPISRFMTLTTYNYSYIMAFTDQLITLTTCRPDCCHVTALGLCGFLCFVWVVFICVFVLCCFCFWFFVFSVLVLW